MFMLKITDNIWTFVCDWYKVEEIHRCINRKIETGEADIPKDPTSIEFAEWLTEQYRLAMARGATLAIEEMKEKIKNDL